MSRMVSMRFSLNGISVGDVTLYSRNSRCCPSRTQRRTVGLLLGDLYGRDMLGSGGGPVRVAEVPFGLTDRGDVLGACLLENLLALTRPPMVIRVHRQQDPALPHPPLVPL